MKKLYFSFIFCLFTLFAVAQQCDSLFSSCIGTFSRNGYFFDIEATGGAVLIEHFSTMSQNCGSRDISVYYRTSTYLGNESSSTGWTLAGSLSAVTPLCAISCPIPVTPINIPVNVTIPQGQRWGFYIVMTAGTGTLESHSNLPEGSVGAQDGMIILYTGKGQANMGTFTGSLTASLTFQGTIQYSCVTSVSEELNTNQVSVFPNPAQTEINFSSSASAINQVEIYNLAGELVFVSQETTVNISSFADGMYFANLVLADGKTSRLKFIKE